MSPRTTWPPYVVGDWRGTHRLIPATYADTTPPFLADLAPDEDLAAVTELTAATSSRLQAQVDLAGLEVGSHELVYDVDYSAIVNAAFAYPGQGGRFSDTTRGAWYAGLDVDTSLAEVAYHKALQLAEIDVWHDRTDYQDFVCDIGGDHFADLTGPGRRTAACLSPTSYDAGQALARDLLARGAAGVVWPSVRRKGGTCVVCFRPSLLPPISGGERWRLAWTGSETPTVTRLPDHAPLTGRPR